MKLQNFVFRRLLCYSRLLSPQVTCGYYRRTSVIVITKFSYCKMADTPGASGGVGDGGVGEEGVPIPSGEECDRRAKEFAEITGTDVACGHFFLQDCDWNLEVAVSRFYNQVEQEEGGDKDGDDGKGLVSDNAGAEPKSDDKGPAPDPLQTFKVLSWNIDGLDDKNFLTRMKAVCTIIIKETPTVIFLQEVNDEAYSLFDSVLSEKYELFCGRRDSSHVPYYTMMLVYRLHVRVQSHKVIPFPTTMMGRTILLLQAEIGDETVTLMTAHLESTKEHSKERIKQLRALFQNALDQPPKRCVIFGGDMNIRDAEIDEAGGLPSRLQDVWVACGKRKFTEYTWDCAKNDNITFQGKFKPRCRFDRLYVSNDCCVKPTDFMLTGMQRIKTCQCFPSDHFGLLSTFNVKR